MDGVFWTAVGSIGGLVAAIVAFFQFRQSKQKTNTNDQPFLPINRSQQIVLAENDAPKNQMTILTTNPHEREIIAEKDLLYRLVNAIGKIPDDMQKHELISHVSVEILTLRNDTKAVLENIALHLSSGWGVWSYQVESTKILAKQAINLKFEEDSLRIAIKQMPSKEEISISLFYTGLCSPELKSENANVNLQRKFEF